MLGTWAEGQVSPSSAYNLVSPTGFDVHLLQAET
jgi:hypothetical protein